MTRNTFIARSEMPGSAEDVYEWHLRPGAFGRLSPPWERVDIDDPDARIAEGSTRTLRLAIGPIRHRWVAVHRDFRPPRSFRDEQLSGPFSHWSHTHTFEPLGDSRAVLEDRIEYALPGGPVGDTIGGIVLSSRLRRMFRYRHEITRADLERHDAVRQHRSRTVAVTGASGLVGTALTAFLRTGGHQVRPVVRRRATTGDEIFWDPATARIDPADWEGVDAVVHLAGENIAAGRWSPVRKDRIRASRVRGTRFLAETLASLDDPPEVLVSASAVGWYGDRGDETVDEDSPAGTGFLADVCREWEAANEPAVAAGVRVAVPRIGVVLAAAGGALSRMVPPFELGLGGRLGNGRQAMPWIALDDLVGIVHRMLFDDRLSGAVNAVAPGSISNAGFTRVLGKVLRRPTPFPVPAFGLRLAAGEMAEALLLGGADVRPTRLLAASFPFRHPELEGALRFELGRFRDPDPDSSVRFEP